MHHKYTNLSIFHRQTTEFQLLSKNPCWKWESNNIAVSLRSLTLLHPTFKVKHNASVMFSNFVDFRVGTIEHIIIKVAFENPGLVHDDIGDA